MTRLARSLCLACLLVASCRADSNDAVAVAVVAEPPVEVDAGEAMTPVPDIPRTPDGSVDTSGGPWRLIEVPAASNLPSIVRAPVGWLALSRRTLGDGKAPSGLQSVLYRSTDGVSWDSVPLDPGHNDLQLRGLAYGAGHYVMVGTRAGRGSIWTSSDAEQWVEGPLQLDSALAWRDVAFAGERFFGFGFNILGVSVDGQTWLQLRITNVQPTAVTHGLGRYLVVGSGPVELSDDAVTWQALELDCALPGACISDPSGMVHQSIHYHALFAEDRFYIDQLSSSDGVQWQAEPGRDPAAYVGGLLLEQRGYELSAWPPGGTPQTLSAIRPVAAAVTAAGRDIKSTGVLDREAALPAHVDVAFEDGLTCETASCVIVDDRLYLVPPPGTPPLADRVPRLADGRALLSDECPVSSMIFCEDYPQRRGCRCKPAAPHGPDSCEDVSHYECAGRFEARPDEWQVEEVAQGGCSCDGIDPNQPASFGTDCEQDAGLCQAPLQCLHVEAPVSFGPPPPQPKICTAACTADADCPRWEATGFCAGPVALRCAGGSCQPRMCP